MKAEHYITEAIPIIGIYRPLEHPSWYYIGEWHIKNQQVHFVGMLARSYYNGMASRSFSYLPVSWDMNDIIINKIKRVDSYKFDYIKEELNDLFTHLRNWIDILPENAEPITHKGLYEEDYCTLKSPGVIYNDRTIYLSAELRWTNDWKIEGSYYGCQHISYYKSTRQESSFLSQNMDYNDFPAVNDFYGFTTLEFSKLYNSSHVKKLSKCSYDLLLNAFENGAHWIYRSIQAVYGDIYIS